MIGEGELDEAPMLFIGERLGSGGTELDVAVDPVEGTDAVADGRAGGLAVIAISERGGLMGAPDMYMEKLVVGPVAAGHVHLSDPVTATLETLARCHGLRVRDLGIALQDRPRHAALVAEIRRAGARVHLTQAGDVIPALEVALGGYGLHALMGVGGAPEGIVTAAALRGIGGEIQGRFQAMNAAEAERCKALDLDLERVYETLDFAPGTHVGFAATAITSCGVLSGMTVCGQKLESQSLYTEYPTSTWQFVTTTAPHGMTAE